METMFQNMQVSKWMHIAFLVLLCLQFGSSRRVLRDAQKQGTDRPDNNTHFQGLAAWWPWEGGNGGAGNQGNNAGGLPGFGAGFGIGIGTRSGNGNGNGDGAGYGSGSGSGGGGGFGLGFGIGFGAPALGPSGEPHYCVPTNCPDGGTCARFWSTFLTWPATQPSAMTIGQRIQAYQPTEEDDKNEVSSLLSGISSV